MSQNQQLQPFASQGFGGGQSTFGLGANRQQIKNQNFPIQGPAPFNSGGQNFGNQLAGQAGQFSLSQLASQLGLAGATGGLSVPAQLGLQAGGVALGALGQLFGGPSIQEQAFGQVQSRVANTPKIDARKFQQQALSAFLPQAQKASQTAQQRFNVGNAQAFDEIFAQFSQQMQQVQQQADMQAQLANLQAFIQNSQLIASFQ